MSKPPPMLSNNRHGEKFYQLMSDSDPRLRVYAYRWDRHNRRRVAPAIYNGGPDPRLLELLREKHNGGEFNLIVRRGEVMELSEMVTVVPSPRKQPEAFDSYKREFGWESP